MAYWRFRLKILIDGDILIYRSAVEKEIAEEDEDGYWTWKCKLSDVQAGTDEYVKYLKDKFVADSVVICLSDTTNFRKEIANTYKGNRAWMRRPVVLKPMREWLLKEREAVVYPTLEGDDVMGILATESDEETIIASIDKDMASVPGKFFQNEEKGVVEILRQEADYNHFLQTLCGDTIDGYKGAKGVGAVTAKKLLDKSPTWQTVVDAFIKAGQTEEDALVQARLAKILTVDLWDHENKKPILWSPK